MLNWYFSSTKKSNLIGRLQYDIIHIIRFFDNLVVSDFYPVHYDNINDRFSEVCRALALFVWNNSLFLLLCLSLIGDTMVFVTILQWPSWQFLPKELSIKLHTLYQTRRWLLKAALWFLHNMNSTVIHNSTCIHARRQVETHLSIWSTAMLIAQKGTPFTKL